MHRPTDTKDSCYNKEYYKNWKRDLGYVRTFISIVIILALSVTTALLLSSTLKDSFNLYYGITIFVLQIPVIYGFHYLHSSKELLNRLDEHLKIGKTMIELKLDIEQFPVTGYTVVPLDETFMPMAPVIMTNEEGLHCIPYFGDLEQAFDLVAEYQSQNPQGFYVPFPITFDSLREIVKIFHEHVKKPGIMDRFMLDNGVTIEEAIKTLPTAVALLDEPDHPVYHHVL